RATLELAEARLAQTRVLAPADGTIIERDVEPGDIVQPGRVLLVLARDGAIRLEAQADEKNLSWLRPGLHAKVTADGLPERPFAAELSWVSPAIDVERGTVIVRFSLVEAVEGLRPDMTVSINLEVAERVGVLLVPRGAVHDEATDHPWVLVVEGGRARRVSVVTGVHDEQQVELVKGIDEQAWIIGTAGIADGARVRASEGR
ncbi:MAG TPA: efflux RND transporter periplasmic adaptor subunit, partial [Polyangiaceae bacterium]|nr:efflux RND transporter periplasmic adaptor subunit [Polyangiaceae bacterium]